MKPGSGPEWKGNWYAVRRPWGPDRSFVDYWDRDRDNATTGRSGAGSGAQDTGLELLEDRSYLGVNARTVYQYEEVTNRLREVSEVELGSSHARRGR